MVYPNNKYEVHVTKKIYVEARSKNEAKNLAWLALAEESLGIDHKTISVNITKVKKLW